MREKKLRRKLFSLTLIGALGTTLLAGCGSSASATAETEETGTETSAVQETESSAEDTAYNGELRELRAAVSTGNFDHYVVLVGLDQGIFEKHGIDLSYTEYSMGVNTVDAIVEGIADVGLLADYAFINRIGNTLNDNTLVAISEQFTSDSTKLEENKTGLYVAPQYVDNLDALDGSEGFETITGTVYDYYNSVIFDYLGIEEEKQNIIALQDQQSGIALAQTGEASATFAFGATADYFEAYGWKLVANTDDLGIHTTTYYITTSDYVDNNTQLLADYLAAVEESFEYIEANLDEVGDFISAQTGADKDTFVSNWTAYVSAIGLSEEGAEDLEAVEKWAYEHGRFDTEFNPRDYIDTRAAELYDPSSVTLK